MINIQKNRLSIRGFEFIFPNLESSLKKIIDPSPTLINSESGQEETASVPTREVFSPDYKGIEDNTKNYKNTPTTHYINESYFLYDKRNLIKDIFITTLNKKVLIYGSISYFNKKTENEIFKMVSPEEFFKFYVNKDVRRNSLSFQLTIINGDIPKLKYSKVYNIFKLVGSVGSFLNFFSSFSSFFIAFSAKLR